MTQALVFPLARGSMSIYLFNMQSYCGMGSIFIIYSSFRDSREGMQRLQSVRLVIVDPRVSGHYLNCHRAG